METTIDLKSLSEGEDLEKLKEAFQVLATDEGLAIRTANDPRKLIQRFMETHWGQFEWAPLRKASGDHLSMITKKAPSWPDSLEAMMSSDHRRCDDLFSQAENAAQKGDLDQALEMHGRFALGMERHFTMEEEGFFSEFDNRMGTAGGGPVEVMREEHQQIRGMLFRMGGALEDGDLEDYLGAADTMLYLMEQHNMKEEQMLYPMADDVFGGDREALLKNLFLL